MFKKLMKTIFVFLIIVGCFHSIGWVNVYAETIPSSKIYTVKESSKPYKNKYINNSNLNKYTDQYYMLRSYFEQLERLGGGTLTLEKGTYVIPNTLYVPSNVTINFMDGVIIKKGKSTGMSGLKVTRSLFQFVSPTNSSMTGSRSAYNGESNISFIGKGTVVIDLDYYKDGIGIVMGHNSDITISGITFKNMYSGHFIEMDATKDVTIENNKFENHKDSLNNNKEAINLDTPDKLTGGFSHDWSTYDCTPNKDVVIQNNIFNNLERAIGTHKYSENQYHYNVQILSNTITNCDMDPIIAMNWESTVIKGNMITDVANGTNSRRAIMFMGVKNPTITGNTFKNVARPIQAMPWKNTNGGSSYAISYNVISQKNIQDMLINDLIQVEETFIRINKTYRVFDSNTDKYYY